MIVAMVLAVAACSGERGLPTTEAMVIGVAPQAADAEAAAAETSVATLTSAELQTLIARGEVVLVDVRTPEEFGSGRIPGALNAPIETFDAASIPIEAERETILYCRSAGRSERAARMLAEHLGATVRHLEGGIIAWEEADGDMIGASE